MNLKATFRGFFPRRIWKFFESYTLLVHKLVKQYCKGKGLEIGPGKHPYCNPATTLFLDKHIDNRDGADNVDIISDATSIPVADKTFDYVFSSHCLEHCANPLKALFEWKRVIKPGGTLFLVLPHCDRTFDRYREKTTLNHVIADYDTLTHDHDYSHIDEIKEGWSKLDDIELMTRDFERDWGFPMWDFESRMKHDTIHYHVWTQNEMIDVLKYIGMKILYVADIVPERHDSFLIVSQK
jgi:SAM-dependent methyltransferase